MEAVAPAVSGSTSTEDELSGDTDAADSGLACAAGVAVVEKVPVTWTVVVASRAPTACTAEAASTDAELGQRGCGHD